MDESLNDNKAAGAPSALNVELGIEEGSRVRFAGYVTASFDFPRVDVGSEGVIVSVKSGTQLGYDFWVKLDDGRRLAFSKSEIMAIHNA